MKTFFCLLAVLAVSRAGLIKVPAKGFNIPGSRIVGGEEAPPHTFPYQVAVKSNRGFCGGSLISKTTVLTAAHCTDGTTEIEIILGAHKVNEDEPTQVRMTTTNFTLHDEWDRPTLKNDISLVYLPEPVELTSEIALISLPDRSEENNDFDRWPARVSGWGKTADDNWGSEELRFVDTYIISNKDCEKVFGSFMRDTNICASGEGMHSTCQGDSGGPLVTFNNGRWIQIGIVSYGHWSGCMKSQPHAYARVTKFLDWIQSHSDVVIS